MATAAPSTGRSGSQATKRSFLEHVQTSGLKLPSRVVLQGVPGIGKTSFAAQAPGVLFGFPSDETGLTTLLDNEIVRDIPYLPPWETWTDVLDSVDELIHANHKYKAFALDGMGSIETLCHQHVCNRDYRGKFNKDGFLSYMQGYETSLGDWRMLLQKLDQLRLAKRMSILILAHTKVAPFKNPIGEDYDRYTVDCHPKTWAVTSKWADIVMFANYYVETASSGSRHKGRGGEQRLLYTEYSAGWDAKNRHNLPGEIDMGHSAKEAWDNFRSALKNGAKT